MEDLDHKWNYYDYLRIIPAIIFAGIIFYFSSLSNPYLVEPPGPPRILELDITINDILHICEYALLSFLVAFGFSGKVRSVYLLLVTIIYAILDEVHQYFVPNRYFSFYDILLDSIGVVLGFLFYIILTILIKRLRKETNEV
ncbi:MAG: VanZ family protein [Promethearchaeota archaeon]|nr:MAG: VanZ family protein [Candidatus Lokiarchaeota archaeon]